MREDDVLVGEMVDGACLGIEELCAACDLEREWLIRRVDEGLLPVYGTVTAEWRFTGAEAERARRMRALERDFDAEPELAALVADMIEEIQALRAQLLRAGSP
ncbi:MAG: MerR family transcriptional regulator [Betaproteobacteria bacterium RIFCSPLOWO2_02_FULL_66_14]|nr:MAG: MerR family transcriptional regulator [Betaproteobacteria bacterium RIFCSPLOWO2_02_FULL_66_14]